MQITCLMLCLENTNYLRNNDRYLDMLPTTFGNPLWFTDDELSELKGTTLYRATKLQVNSPALPPFFNWARWTLLMLQILHF